MQSQLINGQYAIGNSSDSPLYQCKSGGIPVVNTSSPYCIVHGGAKRMAVCCAESSNNSSTVNFQPDCYPWCNVDLHDGAGQDPLVQALRKFSSCLKQDQDAGYSPDMLCENGTMAASTPNASTTTQPAATVPTTSSGAVSKGVGTGVKIAAGLIVLRAALEASL